MKSLALAVLLVSCACQAGGGIIAESAKAGVDAMRNGALATLDAAETATLYTGRKIIQGITISSYCVVSVSEACENLIHGTTGYFLRRADRVRNGGDDGGVLTQVDRVTFEQCVDAVCAVLAANAEGTEDVPNAEDAPPNAEDAPRNAEDAPPNAEDAPRNAEDAPPNAEDAPPNAVQIVRSIAGVIGEGIDAAVTAREFSRQITHGALEIYANCINAVRLSAINLICFPLSATGIGHVLAVYCMHRGLDATPHRFNAGRVVVNRFADGAKSAIDNALGTEPPPQLERDHPHQD